MRPVIAGERFVSTLNRRVRPKQEAAVDAKCATHLLVVNGVNRLRERVRETEERAAAKPPRQLALQRVVLRVCVRA